MANLKKCTKCSHWNPISLDHCEECGYSLHSERIERVAAREKLGEGQKGWDVPIIKIKESYPWYVKFFLYIARAIQVTGLAIGGAMAWSAWWAAS